MFSAINSILSIAKLTINTIAKLIIKLTKEKWDQFANSSNKQAKNQIEFDLYYVFDFFRIIVKVFINLNII